MIQNAQREITMKASGIVTMNATTVLNALNHPMKVMHVLREQGVSRSYFVKKMMKQEQYKKV
ncbi:hypothetical protein ILUMI_19833 [Ignelater luminosus]|uniref:Uncharacterized protein n=1 Tax=Ignelater luminosus TaxID=2038154 RepID=A0A8K0CFF0_IGNLU|nr:hypothetical protein ILUMI_19833 [Ignelater luminosus]